MSERCTPAYCYLLIQYVEELANSFDLESKDRRFESYLTDYVCVDESIHIQKLNKFIGVVAECIAIERKIWFDAESEVRQDSDPES